MTHRYELPPDHVPHLGLGDRFTTVGRDGTLYTDTVESVRYSSAQPAVWPTLSRWQRLTRRLTPRKWRKPLQPLRAAEPATVTIEGLKAAPEPRPR